MSATDILSLKNIFDGIIQVNNLDFHPKDMEKMKDDLWLKSILKQHNGDLRQTVQKLVIIFENRKSLEINDKKYNAKHDKKYSKTINVVGKSNKGFKLLFIDLSEIDKLKNDKEIFDHIIYWFERLTRQNEVENISFAIHSGKDKCMEKCPIVTLKIFDILKIYPNFVDSVFIFEEYLSQECKIFLKEGDLFHVVHGLPPISQYLTFITVSSYSKYFSLDEKYEFSNGMLTPVQKKTEDKGVAGGKGASPISTVSGPFEEQELKEETSKKMKLKEILSKLHTLESQVFELIRVVQELI